MNRAIAAIFITIVLALSISGCATTTCLESDSDAECMRKHNAIRDSLERLAMIDDLGWAGGGDRLGECKSRATTLATQSVVVGQECEPQSQTSGDNNKMICRSIFEERTDPKRYEIAYEECVAEIRADAKRNRTDITRDNKDRRSVSPTAQPVNCALFPAAIGCRK